MSDKSAIESDNRTLAALMRLVNLESRHDLLNELSVRLATEVLVATEQVAPLIGPVSMRDDDLSSHELVDSFLHSVRPHHAAYDYLGDYWIFIWDEVWADGVVGTIFGSAEFDGDAALELMRIIRRKAEDIGHLGSPPFEVNDLKSFINRWRMRALEELSRLKGIA